MEGGSLTAAVADTDFSRAAVCEQARGVLAERFGLDIATASAILRDSAALNQLEIDELAARVVASSAYGSVSLPRCLYADGAVGAAA